jgi:hypothetical protein
MSKLRLIPYAVLTAGLLAAGGASAQSMWSIDQREAQQQDRIRDGLRDGSLTRPEARRLELGEQRIQRYEDRVRANGPVTPAERQRLDGMLNRESRQIYNERHDGERGWGGQEGWRDRREDRREGAWDRREDRREGWRDGREDRREANRDHREDRREGMNDRREDRREANRDGREDHREANRRDFGRDHNTGSGNEGRDHNGWNRDNHGNTASNGSPHQWNGSHNGGGTTAPGTTTPGAGTHSWGGSHSGGTTTGGTTTGGTTGTTAPSTPRWSGGQTRTASVGSTTQTRSYGGSSGGRSYASAGGGARTFGGGGHR